MKSLFRLLSCAFFTFLFTTQASAGDTKSRYVILGPGSYTCQRIVSDMAEDAKRNNPASVIVYSNWLAGNLTSYNRDTKGTYSILGDTSFPDAFAWAVAYCQQYPNKIFASAADALVTKLKPERYTSMPSPYQEEKDDSDDEDDKNTTARDKNDDKDDNDK